MYLHRLQQIPPLLDAEALPGGDVGYNPLGYYIPIYWAIKEWMDIDVDITQKEINETKHIL